MNQAIKKLSASILAASMLLSLVPTAYAEKVDNDKMSTFDFAASDYSFNENDGTATVKITREGAGNAATKVSFKVADLVSEYGDDYEILDDKGRPFKRVEGKKPDPAEFVFKETGEEDEELTLTDSVRDDVEEKIESTEVPSGTKNVTKHDTGSNLLNAQADYLGLPGEMKTEQVEDETEQILDELYKYYDEAQGAECVVEFGLGETEKEITVRINDNDAPNSQKIFSLAITATNNEYTTIAPNATTYVTIQDDEETEPSDYAIVENDIRLSPTDPTANVTIRRTGGEMYFSTVELSTVTLTAPEGSFEALDNKAVAFVPGQTEAVVEIKALDFSKGGTFGLRLDEDCDIDTLSKKYIDVVIAKDFSPVRERTAEEMKNLEGSGAQLETEKLADSGNIVGTQKTTFKLNSMPLETKINSGSGGSTTIDLNPYDGYCHYVIRNRVWGTLAFFPKDMINFSGINKVSGSLRCKGTGWAFQRVSPDTAHTIANSWDIIYPANHVQTDVETMRQVDYSLDVSKEFDSKYLALGVESGNDPSGTRTYVVYNNDVNMEWQKYTFAPQKSAAAHTRKIYDFTSGAPTVLNTFFDGEKTKQYNPTEPVVLDKNGNKVDGFYANFNDYIYIHSADPEKESKNGLYLKGVYLVNADMTAHDMGDGTKYAPSKKFIKLDVNRGFSSGDPYILQYIDQNFVEKMYDAGVITDSSTNIKMFPIYGTRDYEITFYNADCKLTMGAYHYSGSMRYSEVKNIVEAFESKKSGLWFQKINDPQWVYNLRSSVPREAYMARFPSGSILHLSTEAVPSRIPNGISVRKSTESRASHLWYKSGSKIYDELNPNGTTLKKSDYTKAEVVVDDSMTITPVTDSQKISISYLANEMIPDHYKGKRTENGKTYTDLEYSVVTTESLSSGNPVGVDSKGHYEKSDVFTGMEYSFTAIAPEGYVTEWADMTGDLNDDGYIDEIEMAERRRTSSTPAQVYGNVFEAKIDSDQVHLVYHFVPKTTLLNHRTRAGTIERSKANFIQVLNDVSWAETVPVPSAMVSLGGETAMTDYKGKYSIDSTLPALGTANLSVIDADGTHYFKFQNLREYGNVVLPALDEFDAVDISADMTRNGSTSEIKKTKNEGVISVYDADCRVSVTVSSSTAVKPKKAHFFITDDKGNVVVTCDDNTTNYKVNNQTSGTKLTSTLTFNPKKDCYANYQLWVQFEDETGKLYGKIATGYVFSKPLDMGSFIFPMLGSSGLEDFYRSDFVSDLIGDPLGDIGIDAIPLEIEEERYSPSSLSAEAQEQMNWTRYSYSYAWGKDFNLVNKKWGNKKKDSDKDKSSDTGSSDEDTSSDNNTSSDNDSSSDSFDDWEILDKSELDVEANDKMKDMSKKLLDTDDSDLGDVSKTDKDGKPKQEAKSKFKTQGSFNFNISPSVGFRLTLSQRSDRSKYYFEDLLFYAQLKADMSVEQKIVTPIGISVIIGFGFSGKITGIYYMYNNYNGDPLEGGYGATENNYLCPFTSSDFGLFKKFDEGSSVRRDFYLFIDPTLSASLGIDVCIASVTVTAKFVFDFDFRFAEWANFGYGDMKIFMSYKIKVLGIKVWEDNIGSKDGLATVKIFNTDNQNGHISFDPTKAFSKPSGADGAVEETVKFATDDVASRAYLEHRTAWNGTPDTPISDKGTTEITLEQGAASDARVQLMKLNDSGEMLMVFIDDDPSRTDINCRAVYYSIGSDNNWSTPKLLDDDGTLDDYPNICDLGNDKLLVTWSSADRELKDNEGVEEALKALDIKAVFFDKNKKEFGKVEKLTKTTDEDYTADVYPHAAYDKATDRIILFYTKTEYEGIEKIEDIGSAASVTAYLFYEDGKWSNDGSFYTDEELSNVDEGNREYYKKQWYGQRFLDLRTKSESEMFLTVDSTAIGYNGLGLFAWTIDWDKDLKTNNDRDVFLRIYDFEDNYFTHVIKLTNETGVYTKPQFARSENNTYLFFGTMKSIDGDPENVRGEIDYLNISSTIKNDYYTLVQAGEREYYELSFTTKDGEGNDITDYIEPNTAMPTENIEDYDVTVAEDGRMYIFWPEKDPDTGLSAQVNAAYFLGDDHEGASWSHGVKLTDAADGMYYSGIGATVIGDDIKIGAVKSSFADESDNSLVFINHVPYSDIRVTNLDCNNVYPMPGDNLELTAEVKNMGLKAYDGEANVRFTIDGNEVAAAAAGNIPGAQSAFVSVNADCPKSDKEIISKAETTVDGFESDASLTLKKEAKLDVVNEEINKYIAPDDTIYYGYTAELTNIGNLASEDVIVRIISGDTVLAEENIGVLDAKETRLIETRFDVDNQMFTVDEDCIGSLDVSVTVTYGELESEAFNYTITKKFDKETVELLDKTTDVIFENGGNYEMKQFEEMTIEPKFEGVDEGTLHIIWTSSSDPDVVTAGGDDKVLAYNTGKATLTGYVVPYKSKTVINGTGRSADQSILDDIPTDKLKKVTVEVTVSDSADKGNGILGDLDGDGEITSADALFILRLSVGLEKETADIKLLSDVDGDGSVTSSDALAVLRHSVGLKDNDKIGKEIA